MKKIFLTLLAVLSILAFITACGDSTGGNPLIQPENGTGDNSTETNPTDTPSTGGGIAKSLKDRITEAKAGDIIDLGVEKLSITEGESYTISKAITIKNGDAKDGTFTVETTGAKLLNLRNINSIIADEKIQDGDLNIINCYEIDSIYVNGGGANSIHISSTTVTNLFVQKENVRVVLEAATSNEEGSNAEGQSKTATVKNVQIKTDCKLDSTDEKATFKNVQISYDVEKLILSGSANVEKILAESDETATVEIESEDVKIEKTTENVELTTPENSQIQIPSVDKIDTYYTVTVLAYPFTQGSMKLPEGFLFSFEEMIFKDAELEGWYLDSLFTQKATFPHVVNSDVTFYAKFILDKQCKIVFSGNIFVDELTFNYGQIIQESDIPDLTEEVKEYGYIWEGWYLDYETTQPLTFPFIITHDIRVYPKVSQMEGNTGNGETPDDTGNNGNSGTGNSGETDDGDSIISEIDFTIPVTSQEDFEFTVGTWLCEQTSKQGSLDSMIQTTTTKLVFTITETLPTSSIQAIAEKYETIVTYPSQYFSSYEQAKQQYPTSMPEYEFTFDDANLTITMVVSKESLNEISAGYSAITYEQFVSGYLTFGDTIENFTNSEKTALKSINNPDSNIKIETIFVKISEST